MSRTTSHTYEFGRAADACAATGRVLEPGDEFIAALVEHEDETFVRLDYAPDAWEQGARPEQRLFAFWRSVKPRPNDKKKLLVDADTIVDIFEQLADAEDDRRIAFRFVLALILIRKRVLSHEGSRSADKGKPAVMLVRWRGGDREAPPEEVVDPSLDAETVAALAEQIRTVLALDES